VEGGRGRRNRGKKFTAALADGPRVRYHTVLTPALFGETVYRSLFVVAFGAVLALPIASLADPAGGAAPATVSTAGNSTGASGAQIAPEPTRLRSSASSTRNISSS